MSMTILTWLNRQLSKKFDIYLSLYYTYFMTTYEINHKDADALTELFANNRIVGWESCGSVLFLDNDIVVKAGSSENKDVSWELRRPNVTDREINEVFVVIDTPSYLDTTDEVIYTFYGKTVLLSPPLELFSLVEYNAIGFNEKSGPSILVSRP